MQRAMAGGFRNLSRALKAQAAAFVGLMFMVTVLPYLDAIVFPVVQWQRADLLLVENHEESRVVCWMWSFDRARNLPLYGVTAVARSNGATVSVHYGPAGEEIGPFTPVSSSAGSPERVPLCVTLPREAVRVVLGGVARFGSIGWWQLRQNLPVLEWTGPVSVDNGTGYRFAGKENR
jgi:hypothetical protein